MIVAVDDFNMGAMNKLNIFNSTYVLANPKNCNGQGIFINIEAVIGHEYFHN
jgi:alanyl aminopeptidase. Metallo peptidase. MEROPS family M01